MTGVAALRSLNQKSLYSALTNVMFLAPSQFSKYARDRSNE